MPPKKKEPAKGTGTANTAEDFEKLGVFYMGRPYDLAAKQSKPLVVATVPASSSGAIAVTTASSQPSPPMMLDELWPTTTADRRMAAN